MRSKSVVEAGALKAITMSNLDRIDLGKIKRTCNVLNILDGILVPDSVATVT
ncbi:hypothetical protein D3C85_1870800 [compost metagenome]